MVTDRQSDEEREERLHGAPVACLDAVESGKADNLGAVFARHREFAADLAEFLAIRAGVEDVAAPLRALAAVEVPQAPADPEDTVTHSPVGGLPPGPELRRFGKYALKE